MGLEKEGGMHFGCHVSVLVYQGPMTVGRIVYSARTPFSMAMWRAFAARTLN